jgi:phage shock protein A
MSTPIKCDPILALADRIQELTRDLSQAHQEIAQLRRDKDQLQKQAKFLSECLGVENASNA